MGIKLFDLIVNKCHYGSGIRLYNIILTIVENSRFKIQQNY